MHLCSRYGDLEDLTCLAVKHDQLRTLIRVLCTAGSSGRLKLLDLSARLREAADARAASELNKEDQGASRGLNPGGNETVVGDGDERAEGLYSGLTTEHMYQLLYRCYLSLQITDAAGVITPSTHTTTS